MSNDGVWIGPFRADRGGARIAIGAVVTVEAVLGSWLACTVHPLAAWRILQPRGRAMLVGTYVGVGYVTALMLLLTVAG